MKTTLILILALLLSCSAYAGPKKKKGRYLRGYTACPHVVRQSFGSDVVYMVKSKIKKVKAGHKLALYR
jgi:hypothetical protein